MAKTTVTSAYQNRVEATGSSFRNRLDFADSFSSSEYLDLIGGWQDEIGNEFDYIGLEAVTTDRFSYQNRLNLKILP